MLFPHLKCSRSVLFVRKPKPLNRKITKWLKRDFHFLDERRTGNTSRGILPYENDGGTRRTPWGSSRYQEPMKDNENSLLLNWFFGTSQEPRPQIQILDPWTLGAVFISWTNCPAIIGNSSQGKANSKTRLLPKWVLGATLVDALFLWEPSLCSFFFLNTKRRKFFKKIIKFLI